MRRSNSTSNATTDFCRRVRYLIDKYDGGNVTAAARRLRVPQRTLAKAYRGDTQKPRLGLVQVLIRKYPLEDPLWIVLGEEASAAEQFDERVRAESVALVRKLIGKIAPHSREGAPGFAPSQPE